jgi:4-amino-4-deoxy-L-arabinose transferase-like glycosyltransferase
MLYLIKVSSDHKVETFQRSIFMMIAVVMILFLALYHLSEFPLTWFDEGSHLHVPKTLVRFGVYADYSSEGFHYYGPVIGVGPTVMLPIAVVFQLFGIGLLQARLVMALYLLATIYVFYRLGYELSGRRLAWVALLLLISSRAVLLLEYGRQVLGEVPGFFFLITGMWIWFAAWEKASWRRLAIVGLLFGLAMVTKYQYLLFLAPTLGLAWLANWIYYRTTPQRLFVVPGLVAAICFACWQLYLLFYLGAATAAENLASLRESAAWAAFAFSSRLAEQNFRELFGMQVYLGGLLPALVYGVILSMPRQRAAQRWGVIMILIMVNLGWYVFASVGWKRYYFMGLALSSLFVARFFYDLADGFRINLIDLWKAVRFGDPSTIRKCAVSLAMLIWLTAMIILPLGKNLQEIVLPPFNAPVAMARYLDENVPPGALIDTWEAEMGFLTDHNFHYYYYPLGKGTDKPEYILVRHMSHLAESYPPDLLAAHYKLMTKIGEYELYKISK